MPLRWRRSHTSITTGADDREDLFSPVDGFAPAVGFTSTIFDHDKFDHTVIDGYASYKFGREDPGYSLGIERPLFGGPRLFVGAELHDITATDDLWRLSTNEQSLVSLGFKNTFRDYYRRRGGQIFSVFQAGANNEFSLIARWDRHEPLDNSTDFSFFRSDHDFRPNPLVIDQHVNAWVLGYTFDTAPLTGPGQSRTYARHLQDSLFGFGLRQQPGLRLEWTSELAGHGLGGDARYERHIFDSEATSRSRIASCSRPARSSGSRMATCRSSASSRLDGIGTIHGYAFKEVSGTGMALLNAEYRVRLLRGGRRDGDMLAVFGFYDAGRISGPLNGSTTDWLTGSASASASRRFASSSASAPTTFRNRAKFLSGSDPPSEMRRASPTDRCGLRRAWWARPRCSRSKPASWRLRVAGGHLRASLEIRGHVSREVPGRARAATAPFTSGCKSSSGSTGRSGTSSRSPQW